MHAILLAAWTDRQLQDGVSARPREPAWAVWTQAAVAMAGRLPDLADDAESSLSLLVSHRRLLTRAPVRGGQYRRVRTTPGSTKNVYALDAFAAARDTSAALARQCHRPGAVLRTGNRAAVRDVGTLLRAAFPASADADNLHAARPAARREPQPGPEPRPVFRDGDDLRIVRYSPRQGMPQPALGDDGIRPGPQSAFDAGGVVGLVPCGSQGGGGAMSGLGSDGSFELAVEPRSDDYYADDDRWRDQVGTLYTELHAQVDTVQRGRPVEGAKGAVDQLIVALGSAGAFTAAVDCFRAWLRRDRGRRIDVRWDENGVERFVTLTGDAVDVESVQMIARAAAQRVGGPAWQAGTGPS